MIEITVSTPTLPLKYVIGFIDLAVADASAYNLFEEKGTATSPFILDSFLKPQNDINGIVSIGSDNNISIQCKDTSTLKSVKLLKGSISKVSNQDAPWKNKSDWDKYFSWNNNISDNMLVLPTSEIVFNLSDLDPSCLNEICTIKGSGLNFFISFSFTFSYQIPTKSTKTFFGRVDPLIKVSTGGGTPPIIIS